MQILFKCLQCGDCCRGLLKDTLSMLQGLSLFPDETRYFPQELVVPQIGLGYVKGGGFEPKHITLYQLKENVCPFITANNRCEIYGTRPLVCRHFPLKTVATVGVVTAENCRFIKQVEQKMGRRLDQTVTLSTFRAPEEWKTLRKSDALMINQFKLHPLDAQFVRVFNLMTNEWEIPV